MASFLILQGRKWRLERFRYLPEIIQPWRSRPVSKLSSCGIPLEYSSRRRDLSNIQLRGKSLDPKEQLWPEFYSTVWGEERPRKQFLKLLNRVAIWASNSTPGYRSKRPEILSPHENMYMNVHSSLSHKSQEAEKTQMPTTWQRMHQMWHIHTMGYYSSIKRKEALIPATTWMNLEHTTLSERSQTQKASCCMKLFIWHSEKSKLQTSGIKNR